MAKLSCVNNHNNNSEFFMDFLNLFVEVMSTVKKNSIPVIFLLTDIILNEL